MVRVQLLAKVFFLFTVFCFVLFKPLFLRIGLFPFIHTASPLQLHKVLLGDLYSSLHLWSDLWPLFCTWHLKLADTHKASVIVCLPELSLDYSFILQKIWEKMLKKRYIYLWCTYIDHRGILQNTEGPLNAKWLWSLVIRVRKQCESGSIEGPSILGKLTWNLSRVSSSNFFLFFEHIPIFAYF